MLKDIRKILKQKKFLKLFIAAKIIDFDSKNSNRDSHSHEVLDILNFPQVYFFSDKIDIKNNSLFIDGYIDFHGVKIDKNITINFINENNIIKFKGGFDISLNDLLSYGSVISTQNKKKVLLSAVN